MNKFLIIFILLFVSACQPASKARLEETRKDLSELAKIVRKVVESQKLQAQAFTTYVEMPEEVKLVLLQDVDNRLVEAKAVETHIEENSKKECGIFNKGAFFAFVLSAYEVAKPIFKSVVKATAEVAKDQGGVIGLISSALLLVYGVYQQVSKNRVVAKVQEEKEIEHEADKIIPVEHHDAWDNAVKTAKIKVLSKKKGIA